MAIQSCILKNMTKTELITFAQQCASTPLERALLMHMQKITTQRELRIAFWAAHPGLIRRKGEYWNQTKDAKAAFEKFVTQMRKDGHITANLAINTTLAYQ